jgi:alkylation response protein AidB-like acyl-CoA dehydrogenase
MQAMARRRWIWSAGEQYDNSRNNDRTRPAIVKRHFETFLGVHEKFAAEGFRPETSDVMMMSNVARNQGGFGLHFGAFVSTIQSQADDAQLMEWLVPAYQMKITGALAQTELGHGSNVRALQTTATYDAATQEFILCTPTLKAMKWWPGNLGKTATHCLVYANLILHGEEMGFHVFMCQLRDEMHAPLPGVEVGEVGDKVAPCFSTGGIPT